MRLPECLDLRFLVYRQRDRVLHWQKPLPNTPHQQDLPRLGRNFVSKLRTPAGCLFGVKHFFLRAHLTRSPAVPGLNGVYGLSLPGAGIA